METYVYADVIFIENLIMNYIILWSTAKLTKVRYSVFLLLLSAGVGSVYAVLSYVPQYHYFFTPFMKIIFSFLMVVIAFTPHSFKNFVRLAGVFYIVSFVFGGAAFGLFYFINGLRLTKNGVSYIGDFPIKSLTASIFIAYFIVRYCWDYILHRIQRERVIMDLEISIDGKNVNLCALVDTGNALSDPVTQTPVVVAEYKAVKYLLPQDIQKIFEENSQNNFNVIARILSYSEWMTRFRIIPFQSLGKDNGILIGFKPDEIHIQEDKSRLSIKNVIIGIYSKKLSADGEYAALIHPDLLGCKQ